MSDDETVKEIKTVIPAHPGWVIANYCPADEKEPHCFVYDDVIAWEMHQHDGYVEVMPIAIAGMPLGFNWCLKSPSGLYEIAGDARFKDKEAALDHFAKRDAVQF